MSKMVLNVGKITGGSRSWRGMLRNVALVLLIVLLAGGAGVGVRWLQDRGTPPNEPLAKLPEVAGNIQDLRLSGDAEAADKQIQESLDNPSLDNKTRYELYMQQGHSFATKEDYQKAIESYKEAEKADPNRSVAWILGDTYRKLGDTAQAIAYYNKAIERVPTDDPLADNDTEYLRKIVEDLKAGQPS